VSDQRLHVVVARGDRVVAAAPRCSQSSSSARSGGNVYGATKGSFISSVSTSAPDLHGTGVKVSWIEPGMCGGPESSTVRFGADGAKAEWVYAGMQRLLADDIAERSTGSPACRATSTSTPSN
jgi:NADP-dependent 3-hydroxy acid dehydrogenase YdfG